MLKDKILELRQQGYAREDIAERFGLAVNAVKERSRGAVRPSNPWTPQDDEILLKMHAEGHSASQIGKVIGRTRNSVLGRLHRKGLCKPRALADDNNGLATLRRAKNRSKPAKVAKPKAERPPRLPVLPIPAPTKCESHPISFLELERHHCRYPLWENDGEPKMYCGGQKYGQTSWCAFHLHRVARRLGNGNTLAELKD